MMALHPYESLIQIYWIRTVISGRFFRVGNQEGAFVTNGGGRIKWTRTKRCVEVKQGRSRKNRCTQMRASLCRLQGESDH